MGIEFSSGFGNIQPYYTKAYEIPSVTPEEVRRQEEQASADRVQEQQSPTPAHETVADTRTKAADLENVSLTFHKEETFDYIGSESSLVGLDMQKAISDMKKDSILQEYQYFVGSAQNFFMNPADGIVLKK